MATEDNNELRLTRSPTRHAFAWETIVSTVLTVKSSFHCFFKLAAAVRTLVFSKKCFEHCLVFNASGSLALAMRYFSPVSEPVQDQLFFFILEGRGLSRPRDDPGVDTFSLTYISSFNCYPWQDIYAKQQWKWCHVMSCEEQGFQIWRNV